MYRLSKDFDVRLGALNLDYTIQIDGETADNQVIGWWYSMTDSDRVLRARGDFFAHTLREAIAAVLAAKDNSEVDSIAVYRNGYPVYSWSYIHG